MLFGAVNEELRLLIIWEEGEEGRVEIENTKGDLLKDPTT